MTRSGKPAQLECPCIRCMYCTVSVHVGRVRTYYLSGELSFGVITSAVESVFFIGGTKSLGRTDLRGNTVVLFHT